MSFAMEGYEATSYPQPHDPSSAILTYSMQGAVNQTFEAVSHFTNTQNNIRHNEEMKLTAQAFKAKEDAYKAQINTLRSTITSMHTAQQNNLGSTYQSELQTLYQELANNPVGKLPPQIIETQEVLNKKMTEMQTQLADVVAKNANIHNLNQAMFSLISKVYETLNTASLLNQPRTLEEATHIITELNSEVERVVNEIGISFQPVLDN
uniref:Uncharacterized protein n=1 Tax=Clandestinovirus TaxID=2831644 RepID=A0A8F8KRD7_9VIRU|nr:hypothetical protein KOM_12_333 [Clandestinovirus]